MKTEGEGAALKSKGCWVEMLVMDEEVGYQPVGDDRREGDESGNGSESQSCDSRALRGLHLFRFWPIRSRGLCTLILVAHQRLLFPL